MPSSRRARTLVVKVIRPSEFDHGERHAMSSSGYAGKSSGGGGHDHDVGFALAAVAAILLGGLVVVLALAAISMWMDARDARSEAGRPAAASTTTMPGMDMGATASAGALTSYAGAAPDNAAELAAAHVPYPAALPPAQAVPSRTSASS
jgi:hypothetical protein